MGDSLAPSARVLCHVTHPRIFDPPTRPDAALTQIAIWLESPTLMLAEGGGYWARLRSLVEGGRVAQVTLPESSEHVRRIPGLGFTHPIE